LPEFMILADFRRRGAGWVIAGRGAISRAETAITAAPTASRPVALGFAVPPPCGRAFLIPASAVTAAAGSLRLRLGAGPSAAAAAIPPDRQDGSAWLTD